MLQAERDYARVQNNHFLKLSIVCIVPVLTIIGHVLTGDSIVSIIRLSMGL